MPDTKTNYRAITKAQDQADTQKRNAETESCINGRLICFIENKVGPQVSMEGWAVSEMLERRAH